MLRSFILLLCLPLLAIAQVPDPLRFFPEGPTHVVVKVERPRELIEAVVQHDLARKAQEIPAIRDLLDNSTIRKFLQIVRYYERDLGHPWPQLVDKLGGGGLAMGLNYNLEAKPLVLFALQGTDEALMKKFWNLAIKVIEEEASREGSPFRMETRDYEGCPCATLGDEAYVARIGSALLLSNKKEVLKGAINLQLGKAEKPTKTLHQSVRLKNDLKILPTGSLAWIWLNLQPLKEQPQAKEIFTTPRNDVVQTILFAGWLDVARRSDYVAAGLYHDAGNIHFKLRAPAGREGMAKDVELHLPKDPKVGGSLPALEPKSVLFCHSFYLDLETLYKERDAIFPQSTAMDFAEGEKQVSRFLLGTTLPKLLAASGVHHRFVAAAPEIVPEYKTVPTQQLPAFAFVTSMRDPAFAKSMNSIVRAVALAAGQEASLRSWEGTLAGVPAFGYSFPEKGKFPNDPDNLRFNYQPTFAHVKDQYIFASNRQFCQELIELIQKQNHQPQSANMQSRGYATGLGDYAMTEGHRVLANLILSQAVPLKEAQGDLNKLFSLLRELGTLTLKTDYSAKEFQFDIDWINKPKK